MRLRRGLIFASLLLALGGPSQTQSALAQPVANSTSEAPPLGPTTIAPGAPQPPHEVDAAPVALLVDLGSGRTLFARDSERSFLPASVTKTMTAYVAFELMAQGRLHPEQQFIESADAYRHWHTTGSRMFLEYGKPVSVDTLLQGIMTVSANDGCVVLAEGAAGSVPNWVALMNDAAHRLGMTQSHFGTPNGYMDHGNTYVSARDLVLLANAMITRYPAYYHRYVGHPGMTWNGITQRNHDPILGVPGADGIKTGWTNEAHYNFLGSAERNGRRLVMVLAGVQRPREREKASRALLEWGFAQFDTQPLLAAGERAGTVDVDGGEQSTLSLVAPRAYYATLPHGSHAPVQMRVLTNGPLVAPIARGAEVATLEVRVQGEAPIHLPLVAGNAVTRGGLLVRLRDTLKSLWG
jgi:D-alanyl-D-alanine carboxypeptidase (penicillin-binding protein 5/6)